jgi:hypothetical protein
MAAPMGNIGGKTHFAKTQPIDLNRESHLLSSSINFPPGQPNPNRGRRCFTPGTVSQFEDPHPDYPACTYTPPDFLTLTKPVIIRDQILEYDHTNHELGPGTYASKPAASVRCVCWRKTGGERDVWPHLKVQAHLPDSGLYRPILASLPKVHTTMLPKEGAAREVWGHLKREAELPDAGQYWDGISEPFYTTPPASPVRKWHC